MNTYFQAVSTFVTDHKRECIAGATSLIGLLVIGFLVAMFIYNNPSKVVYQPVKACDLFTPAEAQSMLGEHVISVDTKEPVVSGDVATSKCSYTDTNPVQNSMIVAAVAVRSGVNDKGVAQNKSDFAANKPTANVEEVHGIGESAYFNHALGQLDILDGRRWIILSYGVGATPAGNTIDQTMKLARKVL